MPPRATIKPIIEQAPGSVFSPNPNRTQEDTFSFVLPDGDAVIVGHPRGVLKLKMRDILTDEQFKDQEIREIAKALLSVRTVGGIGVPMRNPEHFEALLNRFGSDENVDAFMNEWQKFTNPVVYSIVERALMEATDKGLDGEALEQFVKDKVREETLHQAERVKP